MNFERHVFMPSTAAGFSSISVEMQRDLRHKNFLANYGVQGEGQRWKYSFRDVVAFAVAGILIDSGWNRHSACATAWTEAPNVFGFLRGAKPEAMPHRYLCVLHEVQEDSATSLVFRCRGLSELESGPAFERADVIDLMHLASRLPPDLKELAMEITL